jgi:hypothetical protein
MQQIADQIVEMNLMEIFFFFFAFNRSGAFKMSLLLICLLFLLFHSSQCDITAITIAILAKSKAHCLPMFLRCIERQTWPKAQTYIYIRTNDNTDDTAEILREWMDRLRPHYAGFYFNDTSVTTSLKAFRQHEWNMQRFKVLGAIRQDSLAWAWERRSHYFVVDVDNFIQPFTLKRLVSTNLPIIAPMLRTGGTLYSNYHSAVDDNGYFLSHPTYLPILNRHIRGIIEQPVVHCTYLVNYDVLRDMLYDDDSMRYEYVIFSHHARQKQIPQYLDNRYEYGRITFAENATELSSEPWLLEFA